MADTKEPANVNIRATYYVPQDLDLRMEQMALDLRLTHGVKVSKSELVRGAVELLLGLGPARVYEILM